MVQSQKRVLRSTCRSHERDDRNETVEYVVDTTRFGSARIPAVAEPDASERLVRKRVRFRHGSPVSDPRARATPTPGPEPTPRVSRDRNADPDVLGGGERRPRAAWSYPDPTELAGKLEGALAFYAGHMDRCTVGGEVVTPQPGGFYGGWITSWVSGPFKGEPGSWGW